jgi:hypothetical protein
VLSRLISLKSCTASALLSWLAFAPQPAQAEQQAVVERLTEFGGLSVVQARALQSVVSKRMARAAASSRDGDGVRIAVEQALTSSHERSARAAEVRRRLRAGLDIWALRSLFAERASSTGTCARQFRLSSKGCDALLAAATAGGREGSSAASTRSAPIPPQTPYAVEPAVVAQPRTAAHARPIASASSIAPLDEAPQPTSTPPLARASGLPAPLPISNAARSSSATRPAVLPEPLPPAAAARKAEYDRQREAYWERKRKESEARIARIRASSGQNIQRGPASRLEAEVAGLSPQAVRQSESHAASAAPSVNAKLPRQPARSSSAPAEPVDPDGALMDDLTLDPLGKGR